MFSPKTLLVAPLLGAVAHAGLITNLECIAENIIVNSLKLVPTATPFCSSFLGIKTQTFSTTTTTTLSTVTVDTTTYTTTSTVVLPVSTSTTTSWTTATTCTPVFLQSSAAAKRDLDARTLKRSSKSTTMVVSVPSALAAFESSAISTACSCLSIPTPSTTLTFTSTSSPTYTSTISLGTTTTPPASTTTTTITSTTTSTIACPTPSACGNRGLQYAVFTNVEGYNTDVPYYSSFDPTYMYSVAAGGDGPSNVIYNSTTETGGGIDNSCSSTYTTVYGNPTEFTCNYFALNHRGYLYAPISGAYTFTFSSADDIVFLWTGATAVSGWNRGNTLLELGFTQPAVSASVTMTAGEYLAFRIIYANGQGQAVFDLSVTAPNGDVFFSADSGPSAYIVQYSCDGVSAPPYPDAFGEED